MRFKSAYAIFASLLMFFAATLTPTLAADDAYIGTWKGSWEGAGSSGSFDLSFATGADGKLSGKVAVGTDQGHYNAPFTKLALQGGALESSYDYPLDAQGEVTLAGKFDAKAGSGTWSLGAKGNPAQSVVAGTWKVSKQ